jgi:hypothetical protein
MLFRNLLCSMGKAAATVKILLVLLAVQFPKQKEGRLAIFALVLPLSLASIRKSFDALCEGPVMLTLFGDQKRQ